MKEKPSRCPQCGAGTVAEIVYGLVDLSDPKLRETIDEGQVVLGGDAIISEEAKDWHCLSCGFEWGNQITERLMASFNEFEIARAQEDTLAVQRGILEASVGANGWVTCPYCSRSFATYSKMSWDGERHVTCRTFLRLITTPS